MSRTRRKLTAVFALGLASCAATESTLSTVPTELPSFGYQPVRFTAKDLDLAALAGLELHVAGIQVIDLAPAPEGGVAGLVQGSPTPGAATVTARWSSGERTWPAALRFLPPRDPALASWAAVGASWTQGWIAGALAPETQLAGPAALVVRQAGAYFGLPLISRSLYSMVTADQVPADCTTASSPTTLVDVLNAIKDPDSGQISLARIRLDTALPVRNLAVATARLSDIVHGSTVPVVVMENFVLRPEVDQHALLTSSKSQIAALEEIAPDVVVAFDLFGNDALAAVHGEVDDINLSRLTDLDEHRLQIDELVARIAGASKHAFLANVPSLAESYFVEWIRQRRSANGLDNSEFEAKVATLADHVAQMNQQFAAAVSKHRNVQLVDLASHAARLAREGLDVAGQRVRLAPYSGLLSLDNLHLSATGYAVLANLFIDEINARLATQIPRLEVASILERDAAAPARLRQSAVARHCVPAGL